MRRVRYAVAMSLDGYIAGPQGEADWIEMDPSVDVAAFFREFYAQFDAAIMGRRTYEVFGGAVEGIGSLASAGLVDTVELGVMPVMLGGGRPVISGNTARVKLRLSGCESSGGALSVKYAVEARA